MRAFWYSNQTTWDLVLSSLVFGNRSMFHCKNIKRRLWLEQLVERLAFHADEFGGEDVPLYTPDGFAYYYDPPAHFTEDDHHHDDEDHDASFELLPGGDGFQVMDSPANLDVPLYHSNPSFPKKLYLDFNGHIATGTNWNNQNYTGTYNTGATLTTPAYSADADRTTFNASELAQIQQVWARVSEDYAPFQIDVTTEEHRPACLLPVRKRCAS